MAAANHTIAIIEFLVSSKNPNKLTAISKGLHINISTAYRILSSLKNCEWVNRDQISKKYSIGIRLLEIAFSLVSQIGLRNVSLPFLEFLYNKVKEGVMLSTRIGLERMYIEQIQSDHELRQIVKLGERMPLWGGSPGKAILAYMEKSEIEAVINKLGKSGVRFFASGQVINIYKLRKELSEIRREGFSLSSGERIAGSIAVAAPIFDRDQRVIGAISIGGPMARFSLDIATSSGPLVREIANKISAQLGYPITG